MTKGKLVETGRPYILLALLADGQPHHVCELKEGLGIVNDSDLHTNIKKLRRLGHDIQRSTVYWLEEKEDGSS
jgi:biotin operon repressor